jgi:hypothetical protein
MAYPLRPLQRVGSLTLEADGVVKGLSGIEYDGIVLAKS